MGGPSIHAERKHANRPLEQTHVEPVHHANILGEEQTMEAVAQQTLAPIGLVNAPPPIPEDAVIAPAEPAVIQSPVVKEHMSKSEKKAYKLEQKRLEEERIQRELEQKEQARLAEIQRKEQARLARIQREAEAKAQLMREREEIQRREEALRQERRAKLFNDSDFRAQFSALAIQGDAAQATLMVENLTVKAAEILLQDEEFKEATRTTVDYTDMIMPLLCTSALHCTNSQEDAATLETAKEQYKKMKTLNVRSQLSFVIDNYVVDALQEEFSHLPVFQRNEGLFSAKNQATRNAEMRQVNTLGQSLSKRMGTANSRAMMGNPILRDTMKGASYTTFKTLLEQKIASGLDDDTAMNEVVAEMRVQQAQRREIALTQSYQCKNVPGADMERVKTYGMTSSGTIVIPEDAQAYIQASKGFIAGEVMSDGNVHLYPTLPEMVTSNGIEIPLRKTYTHFQRLMTRALIGEHGELRMNDDGEPFMSQLINNLDYLSSDLRGLLDPNRFESIFRTDVLPHLETLIKEEAQEPEFQNDPEFVQRSIQDMTNLFLGTRNASNPDNIYSAIICKEYLSTWSDFITSKASIDEMPLEARMEILEGQMKQPGFIEGRTEVLSDAEKETMRNTLRHFYSDAMQATGAMMSIRNIPLDTSHVPLINACSAHGNLSKLMRNTFNNEAHTLNAPFHEMSSEAYVEAHPDLAFQFFQENDLLPQAFLEKRQTRLDAAANATAEKTATSEPVTLFTQEEKTELSRIGGSFQKFSYHTSSPFLVGSKIVTTETCAADTTQYCVSPLTVYGAVGVYQNAQGFQEYYTADSPFTTASETQMGILKHKLTDGQISN